MDGTRYMLLREGVPHSDGNFSLPKMVNYLNGELADTLGTNTEPALDFCNCPFQGWKIENIVSIGKETRERNRQDFKVFIEEETQRHFCETLT